MPTDQEWLNIHVALTPNNIELRISELQSRIRKAQHELTVLVILRAAIKKAAEFRAISERKAREVIDTAINQANDEIKPLPIRMTNEGGIEP